MDRLTTENGVEIVQKLPAIDDEFGGVVVEMKEHMDSDVFCTLLKTSMSQWKLQGKKGVWIKLPINLSNLVDTAVKEGFWYHHAEPEYLMLLYWIPETVNPIPGNASHIARVGAIILNDKWEMLVVQEKMGTLRGVWKISTGTVHQGEDICKGVVREVKEETGVVRILCVCVCEGMCLISFCIQIDLICSQEHNVFFGKSEILFLCMMRPLSFEIHIQETEIEAAQDPAWKYGVEHQVPAQGGKKGYKYIKCNFCSKVITGGVKRMKEHLGCTHKDVAPCDKVPPEVKEEILHYLKQFQENKVASQHNFEESVGSGAYYSGDGSVNPSSSSRGVRGPMDRFMGSARDNEDGSLPNEKMTPASAKEHRNRRSIQHVAILYQDDSAQNYSDTIQQEMKQSNRGLPKSIMVLCYARLSMLPAVPATKTRKKETETVTKASERLMAAYVWL
ncbi:hypothetical protein E3N88_15328 [Mikania micrantha]|uniref:Nudix hydrolase domain-containing protein n=1 Tax=Mikania micrantha TaxID=192012 RepID=A0A5N6NWJ8_9ASTR|nr:hypothetical protein E3N88_15328 [Mikania micrantha]